VLLEQNVAASVAGGIVTYAVEGKQYVAVTAGNISRATFGGAGSPQVIIYTLGLAADQPNVVTAGAAMMPWDRTVSKDGKPDAKSGRGAYANYCAACHGSKGEGGVGPSLQGAKERLGFDLTLDRIKNPLPKMPRLPLDEQTLKNVTAYVETLK
jgi:alcohol dehydrogenase (cytochrome c)